MGELKDRWDAIGYTEAASVARGIIRSDDPSESYQEAIAGKTAEQILAIQISLYAYHSEGNEGNFANYSNASMADFEAFANSNVDYKATVAAPETVTPREGTDATITREGDVITVATKDGFTFQLDWSESRGSEYGFNIKIPGTPGVVTTIATTDLRAQAMITAIQENRGIILQEMQEIVEDRLLGTDSDNDEITVRDANKVLAGLSGSIEDVDGRMNEVVDAMSVIAMEAALKALPTATADSRIGTVSEEARNEFLTSEAYTTARANAEAVLAADTIAIDSNPAVSAKDRYDFITKFESEAAEAPEMHDPNAMTAADLNTEWAKFHGEGFDRALSPLELEAVALANVMFQRKADNSGWEQDPATATLTLEQAQAHPDYIAVMEAHAAFESAPSITIAAGTEPAALSITAKNLDDPAALAAYLETHGAALEQQARDILYGTADDDGITMEEASAVISKINTQLETVEAGSLEETILNRVAETINHDWDVANNATVEPAAGGDPRIETETGGDPSIREIQLYAAMAKLGNFAPLQAIEISEIDGLSGRKTGNSMINMLDMTGTELRALAGPQAAAELLDQQMRDNADFRGNVLAGLRDAVSTDPEDVREFLSYQGIEVAADATPATLLEQVEAYAQTFGDAAPAADVEASVSISVPSDETIAFDITIAGVTTPEELTAYLAEHGERIDTEIRTALYSDFTVVNVEDGLSAEELTTLNGWIDAQMEGASDVEKVLLERARGIIEADTTPGADNTITVTANTALIDDDRVLDGNILEDAQAVIARAGGEVPEAGILAIIEGSPMLVRQIEGETIVTQIHEDNFDSVLGEGVALDSHLEGKLRERADMGDTSVRYRDVTIGVNPATANLLGTDSITIQQGRKDGLVNTFVSESTGKGVIIESEELADAIDHFDGRAPRDERFVTNYNLPGEFDSASIARGLDALERAIDNNGAGSLSVEFVEGANGTTAEINYGDGQKLEIPKGLYDAIMERANHEATRDHSQVVEVSAPTAGMGS